MDASKPFAVVFDFNGRGNFVVLIVKNVRTYSGPVL